MILWKVEVELGNEDVHQIFVAGAIVHDAKHFVPAIDKLLPPRFQFLDDVGGGGQHHPTFGDTPDFKFWMALDPPHPWMNEGLAVMHFYVPLPN